MTWWIWLGIAIALLIIEFCTEELISIWFSAAAIGLCILTAIFPELHWGWQVFIFAILSTLLVLASRPLVKRFLRKGKEQKTNLDLIIDETGFVEEEIDNDLAKGTVKIRGLSWSARSESGEKIEEGCFVTVRKIEGNKLFVIKRKEDK